MNLQVKDNTSKSNKTLLSAAKVKSMQSEFLLEDIMFITNSVKIEKNRFVA